MKDEEIYHTRKFLNPLHQASWASIQCFYGYGNPEYELQEFKDKPDIRVVLQGCHNTVALHKVTEDMTDFISKLRVLTKEVNTFADWLEKYKLKG